MFKIESLKKYVGKVTNDELMELARKIYMITSFICDDYSQYKEWFFNKQLFGTIISSNRNILFVRNPENSNEIISMACLKRDEEEKKICTLYVLNNFRGQGIGEAIIEKSMEWLGTTKPFITFADYKLEMFKPFINKYNWKLVEVVSGFYNDKSKELCFNGTLSKNNDEIIKKNKNNI